MLINEEVRKTIRDWLDRTDGDINLKSPIPGEPPHSQGGMRFLDAFYRLLKYADELEQLREEIRDPGAPDEQRSCGCMMGNRWICVKHCGGHGIPEGGPARLKEQL